MSLPTVFLVGSLALSGAQAIFSAMSQAQAAKVAEKQAEIARQQSKLEAYRQQRRWRKLRGEQIAKYGAAGLDITSGTPLQVIGESAEQAALDKQIILWGGKARATAYENEAALYRSRATGSLFSGLTSMAGTLVTSPVFGSLLSPTSTPAPTLMPRLEPIDPFLKAQPYALNYPGFRV